MRDYRGYRIAIELDGPFDWVAVVTDLTDERRVWRGSGAWTPWGARHDAREVIDQFLFQGRERRRAAEDKT